ncbi:MAG TPA: NAD(P)H-dependent oxidoreductase [Gemmatimonadaceae bacterium]|nr:NAD(P)H-dependent oxidoreductase [Gemmatimonadaceae bacterium]
MSTVTPRTMPSPTAMPAAVERIPSAQPLSIPIILGTARKGRLSAQVARFLAEQLASYEDVATDVIDVAALPLPTDDAGEAIKDPAFSAAMARADALVIVAPEYNHSFPGLLKHALDTNLKEYIHKAAGVVGVSAGPFGGTRVIESMLPVLRELGLAAIFWDVNFGSVASVFDERGTLRDTAFVRRAEKFAGELIWMARALRHGRDRIPADARRAPMPCPRCGTPMNQHADKLVERAEGSEVLEMRACPHCANIESRPAPET